MRSNTPELWDAVWAKDSSAEQDRHALLREEHSIRWQRMERRIVDRFGRLRGLEVIELGAGAGTVAALMARRGARVTVLDFSPGALERSRSFFGRNRVAAEHVLADALAPGGERMNAYDVSMSFGLAEHFTGPDRARIVRAHLDVLKRGGLAFVSLPNRWNLPYRLFKLVSELSGRWPYGVEVPGSRGELASIARGLGVRDYGFLGDSLVRSLRFLPATPGLRKVAALMRRRRAGPGRRAGTGARFERGTFLDPYLSYALVLVALKP